MVSRVSLGVLAAAGTVGVAHAITMRHDVAEQQYRDLALQYPAVVNVSGNSGTLIGDRFILTAAHFGVNVGQAVTINGQNYTVATRVKHPQSSTSNLTNGYDLQFIKLNRAVVDVVPIPFYRGTADFGKQCTIIGFGDGGTGITGSASPRFKRAGTNIVEAVYSPWPRMLLTDFDSPAGNTNTLEFLGSGALPLALEAQVATGDSGGAVIIVIGGQQYLAATISGRSGGGDNSKYGSYSVYTRTTSNSAWIDEQLNVPGLVHGDFVLDAFEGNLNSVEAVVEIRSPGTTAILETHEVIPNLAGIYSIETALRGTYDIAVKGDRYLRKVYPNVAITESGAVALDVALNPGDINGDNEVNLDDYFDLADAFRAMPSDANWNPMADLNGDLTVNLDDYFILAENFRTAGDD